MRLLLWYLSNDTEANILVKIIFGMLFPMVQHRNGHVEYMRF